MHARRIVLALTVDSLAFGDEPRLPPMGRASTAQTPVLVVQLGHQSNVYAIALLPDGKHLVSAGYDSRAIVWDLVTGLQLRTFALPEHSRAMSVSADGQYLATNGWKDVHIYSIATGQDVAELKTPEVRTLAFHPKQFALATAGGEPGVTLHALQVNPADGHVVERGKRSLPTNSRQHPWQLAFDPAGKILVGGMRDNKVHCWDLNTGRETVPYDAHAASIEGLAISNRWIVSVDRDSEIVVWDRRRRTIERTLQAKKYASAVAISLDSHRIAVGSSNFIEVWDLHSKGPGHTIKPLELVHNALAFAADGSIFGPVNCSESLFLGNALVSQANANCLANWDSTNGEEISRLRGFANLVMAAHWLQDGENLAALYGDSTIKVWQPRRASIVKAVPSGFGATDFALGPHGEVVYSSNRRGAAYHASGKYIARSQSLSVVAGGVADWFSSDGKKVATV